MGRVHASNGCPFEITVGVKHVSQLMRRLDLPIMHQLFDIEFDIIDTLSNILANGVLVFKFAMQNNTFFVPETTYPEELNKVSITT